MYVNHLRCGKWATRFRNWMVAKQQNNMVFLYECRFTFYSDDGGVRIWREFNTKNEPGYLPLVKMNIKIVSVVVCEGKGFHRVGDMVVVNRIVDITTFLTIVD